MKTYEIVRKQTVTQEQIDDVLTDAFEGGVMADWCQGIVIVDEPDEEYQYASEVITRGGKLKILDEDEEPHELTLDKLLKGFAGIPFDFDDYDAVDADAVVQYALFGEVIYG